MPFPDARLNQLADATAAFSSLVDDLPALYEAIVGRTAVVVGGYCALGLVTADGEHWERVAAHDVDPAALARMLGRPEALRMRRDTPGTVTLRAIDTGETVWMPDLSDTGALAGIGRRFHEWITESDGRSLACVPIRVRDAIVGSLLVVRRGATARLTENDRTVVETIARHAGLAIANARALEQIRGEVASRTRIADRLRFLSETSRAIAQSTHDLQGLLDLVAHRCGSALRALCTIRLVSPDGAWLEPEGSTWHVDPDVRARSQQILLAGRQPVGQGMAGRVAATREMLLIPVMTTDEAIAQSISPYRSFLRQIEVASLVMVPVVARGLLVAVLGLSRSDPGDPFDEADAELARDVADQAGIAVANGRLLRALRSELSERAQAESALRQTEQQLRQAQKMEAVGRLAGGVAHDFNNLLSVVLSYTAMLLDDLPSDARIRPDLEEIQRAGERAAELTAQLLTLSRNRPPNPQRIDLVDTVAQLIRMVTRVVGEDVAVEWIPDAASWGVVADPSQVAQVMLNLVINARDAMPDGGRLTIETANVDLDEGWVRTHLGSAAGPHVMLAVTDTGVGMDAATLERVFEPFFTTKDHGKGTGLGLSIVYGIVQQSNGHVWVYSEPGHGTSVKIFLPRADGPLTPAGGPSPIPRGGEERVLVVEDDDQVRAVAVGILQRHGYRVTAARTPAEAIDWFERDPTAFDLLLTDVIMPGLTGRELAAHLHTVRPTLRVLFMSGYTDNTFRTVPAAGTSTPLLQKPLTPSTLLRSVRDALER